MKLLTFLIQTQSSRALSWTLIHSLWEGLVIVAVLAALLVSVRSPRMRYAAGWVALLALLASFAITLLHFLPGRGSGARMSMEMKLPPWSQPTEGNGTTSGFLDFGALIPWLAPLWIVGVCLFYMRYAASWLPLYGIRRRGVCKAPDSWQRSLTRLASELMVSRAVVLLESLLVDTPVVLGHFRPAVLVPLGFFTGLSPEQVEVILIHELAHIGRSDYLVNACQRLIEGLLFYHPAVWWISRVIRTEREHCCDDAVVALRGDAHGYARALAAIEQNRLGQQWPTRDLAVAATGGDLMKRVKRLLYPKGPSGIWAPALAAVVLMASTAAMLSAWRVDLHPTQTSEQADKKLATPWQKWLNEDVVYIISEEEKKAFERLTTDEERQYFVDQFWARRDPTPGTPENEFKEEHYRRMAYANDHWRGDLPGWKTDRGRIYIRYGPPDEIDAHPSGGLYHRPEPEGGGSVMTYPFEDWRYVHFENVGSLDIEFVDVTSSGEFRMTLDQKEKYKKP